MAHEEQRATPARFHSLSLQGREKLSVSGVQEVEGFDEGSILLTTSLGTLHIGGQELHIEKIDTDSGVLELRGHISELSYDEPSPGGSFWTLLFG